jgi:hypothetical protein
MDRPAVIPVQSDDFVVVYFDLVLDESALEDDLYAIENPASSDLLDHLIEDLRDNDARSFLTLDQRLDEAKSIILDRFEALLHRYTSGLYTNQQETRAIKALAMNLPKGLGPIHDEGHDVNDNLVCKVVCPRDRLDELADAVARLVSRGGYLNTDDGDPIVEAGPRYFEFRGWRVYPGGVGGDKSLPLLVFSPDYYYAVGYDLMVLVPREEATP